MVKRIIFSQYFLIGLLIVLYFFPVIFQNQVFYYGDTVSIFLPFRKFFFDNFRKGIFPLWNPHVYSGYPFFADMTLSNYYLPAFILFLETSIRSVSWLLVGHFFLAGFFMYRLGRLLKLSSPASFFISIVYSFSGILVNYTADPQRFFVIALFPLFFYSLFRAFEVKKISGIILSSLALSLQIFAGHVQYVFIELLVSPVIIFLSRTRKEIFTRLVILMAVVLLALLFSSISLIPALELIPYTTRQEAYKDLSIFQNYSLNPISLVRFFFAHFWGIKNQGSGWGTMDTTTIGYIGFLPLLLVVLNLKKILRGKITLSFLIIAVTALIISFGTYLPFFKIFTTYIPIFRLFRNPMVFLSLYTFFMSLLAGYSFDFFKFKPKKGWLFFGFFSVTVVSAVALLAVFINHALPHFILLKTADLIHKSLSTFHNLSVDWVIADFILKNFLIIGLFGSLTFWFKRKRIIIIMTVIDLFFFTRSNLYTIDYKYFTQTNPVAAYLADNLGDSRFLSSSEAVPYSGLNDFYGMLDLQSPFTKENQRLSAAAIGKKLSDELRLIPPNFSAFYGLATVNGYTSFVIKRYNDLFQKNSAINPLYEEMVQFNPFISQRRSDLALSKIDFGRISLDDDIFKQLAVKYFVTNRDLGLPKNQLVFSDGDVSIYQNDKALPRAVLLDNQQKIIDTPSIIQKDPNKLELQVKNKGRLVVYDTYYPGWTATVNNQPAAISPYENIFRSVVINEDNSRVIFNFQPQSFYLGAKISLISLSLILLAIYFKIKYRYEKSL
ncbi:MAG: hypothetical protein NTZ93_02735 [Candidatus Beckwithbacteria bacterium]|nr:hypothetical protein [Candidatus Beckwithbacteria bacterium]